MAESVVSFLVQTLAETLTPMAIEEMCLLKNVRTEMEKIKYEFSSMQALLTDADAKEDTNDGIKVWVKQVRDAAYETEDVIEDFMLFLHRHHQQPQPQGCSMVQLKSICNLMKNPKRRHKIAHRIRDIKVKVEEIAKRKNNYSLTNWEQGSTSTQQHDPREDALFLKETEVVGIDKSREQLIRWLVEHDGENRALGIISVYGAGGLGKTTLVKKVFDNQTVREHFPCRHWVTVSQTPDIKRLLQDMLKQLFGEEGDIDATRLKETLQSRLGGKRYLVVLDDVWTMDAWNAFKNAFPDDMKSASRIMVTTRSEDVASRCVQESSGLGHKFQLPYLKPEDAFKLFSKKALGLDDPRSFPPHLKEISDQFLRKCMGLPLAIASIAGLLRTKEPTKWDQVYGNLGYLMGADEHLKDMNLILSLSYIDLPSHLKSCFLYFCIFPEDATIKCTKLFRLWAAEGLVERKPGMKNDTSKKDTAQGYLSELISRSLVQVEGLDGIGRVKTCRIHDILREFILSKAYAQDLLVPLVEQQGLQFPKMTGRCLSVIKTNQIPTKEVMPKKERPFSRIRSFFLFGRELFLATVWSNIFANFSRLRVLDLEYMRMSEFGFPSEVTNLFYLRYLCVKLGDCALPSSIGNLTNLETLVIRDETLDMSTAKIWLPKSITMLKCLRHLIGYGRSLFVLPMGMEKLTNLEKLCGVDANVAGSGDMLKGLGMLTNMRSLTVSDLKKEDGMQLVASLGKMKYLRSIRVASEYHQDLDMHTPWSPPPRNNVEKLHLHGRLHTCPPWLPNLEKLTKLTLFESSLKGDGMESLQTLPSLAQLILAKNVVEGEELCFNKGGFPRLRYLVLYWSDNLKSVKVEDGAMPLIQNLILDHCEKLENAPLGIKYLTTLTSIKTWDVPKTVVDGIKNQVWKDGHAPSIEDSPDSHIHYVWSPWLSLRDW